ncbi:hypothetical protein Aperf_G00000007821 [Anoplocephala perfoliata]
MLLMASTPLSALTTSILLYFKFLALYLMLCLPNLSSCNDEHLVFAGACNKEDPNFCDRIVRNSVCNKAKNECFCRKGFVAVKEGDSVACKTLLTDLKCRVDADCVHVNRSSCHPGAGYCTCPGNTVFVPQLNACRTKLFDRKSLVCASCLQEGGSCFAFEIGDQVQEEGAPPFERYGCVCPNLRTNTQFRDPSRPQRTCGAQLADIGDLCNEEDLRCRSPLATCRPLEETSWSLVTYGTCVCPPEYIPVFQKLLRFYECFPRLSFAEKSCQQCVKNEGECYRLTESKMECKCPPDRSNAHSSDGTNSGVCKFRHIQTVCENALLLVCYVPHWYAPYEDFSTQMDVGTAQVRLESAGLTAGPAARLKKASLFDEHGRDFISLSASTAAAAGAELWRAMMHKLSAHTPAAKNVTFNSPFCTQIDLLNDPAQEYGIRLYNMGGGRTKYRGAIEVVIEDSHQNPTRNLHLPFSCIDQKISRERQEEIFQSMNMNANVSLTIVNENLQEVDQIGDGENISLLFSLLPTNNGVQGSIVVESCFASISGSQFSPPSIYSGFPIYAAGCTTNNDAYRIQFEQSQLSGRQLQTQMFQVFRIENFNSLFIRCFIKYCPQSTICSVEHLDCSDPAQSYTGNKKQRHTYQLFDRWVHLNIVSSPKESLLVTSGRAEVKGKANLHLSSRGQIDEPSLGGNGNDDMGPCRYAICLTHPQLISVSVITVLIILVVLTISLVALKRQNQFRRNELLAAKKQNCTTNDNANWTSPMNTGNWSNQTPVFQPLVLSDATIQRNPVASITSSVYSRTQPPNAAFIRSPNNAVSLFHARNPADTDSKCRNFKEMQRTPTSEAGGTWAVTGPTTSGKKIFTSTVNKAGPFELQPLEFYESEAQGSVGLYAPFLCIRETSTIKNDTHSSECFVVANNSGTSTHENSVPVTTQFIMQKTPTISSQPMTSHTTTLQRMYSRPPAIGRAGISAVEPFSPMKFLTESEDVITEGELSLSSSNILNDEQNV